MADKKKSSNKEDWRDEYQVWCRLLAACNAEKEWMRDRLNWLFIPQAVLFAAYAVILAETSPRYALLTDKMILVIPMTGMALTAVVFVAIFAARVKYREWWNRLCAISVRHNDHLTFGTGEMWPAYVSSWVPTVICVIFFASWAFVLFFAPNPFLAA